VRKKDKEGDKALVYSMDQPGTYGPIVHTLSFAKAAKRGIICNYKIIISVVTSEMINADLLIQGEVIVEGDVVRAHTVANQIAIQKACQEHDLKKIFSFHRNVASARDFTGDTTSSIKTHLPEYATYHVNGEMQTASREKRMRAFREADRAIMSNARCLTEGVDVPAVDVVAFLSPRKSKVDIVQATGRAMRTAPGKETGYVLLPLFLETHENESLEEAVKQTDFEEAWDVLQAMQEQDELLAEVIREMREERGRLGGFDDSRLRERVEVLGPEVSLEVLRNAVNIALVDQLGITWDERYGQLKHYKERFGDCKVPRRWQENPELGVWTVNQRRLENQEKLPSARKARLDALGFEWDLFDFRWGATFAELKRYWERFGDCNVPNEWLENPSLARWVQYQRDHKRRGRLNAGRVSRLDDLNFDWQPNTTVWETKFAELKSYGEANGHCRVKKSENRSLAMWVGTQRKLLSRGGLDLERVKRLQDLGFEWEPLTAAWKSMFVELERYKEQFGNCNVPTNWRGNPELAIWVNTQRKAKIKGDLDPERAAKLTELGCEWHPHATAWETRFTELTQYKERFGDCNVPGQWSENPRLATWVGTQRNLMKKSELDPERVRRLQDLGFEWDLLTAGWERMFAELLLYRERYGDCDVPARWPDKPRLAAWVSTQRHRRSKDKLSSERIHRLDAVGFSWGSQ